MFYKETDIYLHVYNSFDIYLHVYNSFSESKTNSVFHVFMDFLIQNKYVLPVLFVESYNRGIH